MATNPTLTSFTSAVASGKEDNTITVTFAKLQTQGNEADADGSVTAFVVKSVSTGKLKIGTSAATATVWNALSNNTIDATHFAYWVPDVNANGTLNAFTVVAKDNSGLESATPVQAQVKVAGVLDVDITAGVIPVESGAAGTFIITLDNAAPVGGLTVNYSLAGTATLNTDYTVTAGSNISAITNNSFTIAAGQKSATLNINAVMDTVSDPNETVEMDLNTGANYQFGSNSVTSFAPRVDYATLTSQDFSLGDVNSDGKLDLVIANLNAHTVSVMLRSADNTDFDPTVDYAVGDGPNAITLGDFNNDGKLDIATCCWGGGVYILTRNATNTDFTVSPTPLNTGVNPIGIATGDFNSDGKLDLAVTNSGSGSVSVFLRNATNTGFNGRIDYVTGATPRSVAAGDFNNDGKLDLAVTNYGGNSVSVLMRNVTNTGFDDKVDYGFTSNAASVSVADFNSDGKLDLAVSLIYNSTVSVLLRNADNTGFNAKVEYPVSVGNYSVSTGDFNNDGKQDIAATGWYGTVSVLLRNSSNTGFDPKIDLATDSPTYALHVGDINNDGKLDIVSSSQNNTISILTNINAATLSITNNNAPTGKVIITGLAKQAEILTASNTLADVDGLGTINYQWQANGVNINGAVNNTYRLTSAEFGKTITVTASYTDMGGALESKTSAATTAVGQNFADVTINGDQGGSKSDVLEGASGNDYLNGLTLNDTLFGYAGNDTLYGSYGYDSLYGGDDNDTLYGEQDADYMEGGAGNDTLDGGLGLDTMIGGSGNDTYYLGYDIVDVIDDQGLSTDIDTVIMPYQLTTYTLPTGIENGTITAGTQASDLIGNASNNNLTGNAGDNHLNGGVGNDTLYAASGNDTVDAGSGNDEIIAGNGYGNDFYIGGTGTDTIMYKSAITGITVNLTTGIASGNEIGTDTLRLLPTDAVTIENITGGIAGDNLTGNAGNNVINGYTGADTMIGGLGNDTYVINVATDRVTELTGQGTDTIQSTVSFSLLDTDGTGTNGGNVENLQLLGTAAINGTGNARSNILTGNAAANILNGLTGNDILTGGAGKDIFRLTTAGNVDTIKDFSVVDDTIQLENAIFTKLTATGALATGVFRSGAGITSAADSNDYLIYNTTDGKLYYDADASLTTSAPVQIALIGTTTHAALTYADFAVI